MKKNSSLFLVLCLCTLLCSCTIQAEKTSSQISSQTTLSDTTTEEIKKLPCAESGCNSFTENSIYCASHSKTYEKEREYYYDINIVLKKLASAYGYSATKKYEVKEVIIDYAEISQTGKAKGLTSYINIYVYFSLGAQNGFIEYGVLDRQFGISPKIEFTSESMYTIRRKQALGGDSYYNRAFRNNHHYRNIADYTEIGTFVLNFEDYSLNGYSY